MITDKSQLRYGINDLHDLETALSSLNAAIEGKPSNVLVSIGNQQVAYLPPMQEYIEQASVDEDVNYNNTLLKKQQEGKEMLTIPVIRVEGISKKTADEFCNILMGKGVYNRLKTTDSILIPGEQFSVTDTNGTPSTYKKAGENLKSFCVSLVGADADILQGLPALVEAKIMHINALEKRCPTQKTTRVTEAGSALQTAITP